MSDDDAQCEFNPDFVVISSDKRNLGREFKKRVFFKYAEHEEDGGGTDTGRTPELDDREDSCD